MNARQNSSSYRRILATSFAAAFLAALPARAAILTWDLAPGTVGPGDSAITGGTGTWDTTSGFWTLDGGVNDVAWVNANNDQAVFGGLAGTVTLGTGITANALTFNSSGYVITGNTLTLAGTTPTITVGAGLTDTISSILGGGTASLVVAGGGTLTLSAVNTFTGGTTVNGSTLNLTVGGGSGTVRGPLTINSGSTVNLNAVDALGFTTNVCVSTVNINGGTLNNTTAGNEGFITNMVLTGGTISSTGGGAYNFNTGFGITTNASSTTSLISANMVIRGGSLTFNTAVGSAPGGIDLNVTGVISGGANSVTKTGNGTMSIGATTTYTGGTTVNGGVLNLTAGGGATGVIRGTATVNSGATLRLSTGDALGYATQVTVLNVNSGTVNVNSTANQTFANMNMTLNAGTISGIAGSNIDLFNNGTVINTTAAAASSVISIPTLGLRQNDTAFNIADGAAPVDLLVSGNLINNSGANNQGNHNLVKNGNGVMQLTGANSYTGTTKVNAGTFALSGAGTLASPSITVTAGAVFDVSGLSSGSFTLGAGQTLQAGRTSAFANDVVGNLNSGTGLINVAGNAVAGTLTLGGTGAGNLTLSGGTVNFDLANVTTVGGGINDLVKSANLTLTGTTSIAINKLNGALISSTYTLFSYTGALVGSAANLTLSGAAGGTTRQNFALDTVSTPGSVLLSVTGNSANLIWAGDGTTNAWDIVTTANFTNGGSPDKYFEGDAVTFDDTGSNTPAVLLATTVSPGVVTFNNTTKDYTLSGAGGIAGGTGLTKNGSGTLTVTTTNSFAGPVAVNAGTLSVASIVNGATNSPLGAGTLVTLGDATHSGKLQLTAAATAMTSNRGITVGAGGGTLELVDAGSTLAESGTIVLNGPLTKTGNGTLTLSTNLSGPGSLNLNAGALTVTALSSYTGNLNVNAGTFTAAVGGSNGTNTSMGAGNGTRSVNVGPGATMIWTVNNTLVGGGGNAANLPTINLNGATLSSTRYNAIGNVALNSGSVLTQAATDGPGAYEGYQFIGTISAGGTSASSITSTNGRANHLKGGATTTFNVANATGDASPDLTVSSVLRDGSGDYAGVGSLQKTGVGTLLLTAANTYTGSTTINGGTLALAATGNLASTAITVGNGGNYDLSAVGGYTLNSGVTVTVSAGGLVTGPLTVGTGSTLVAGKASGTGDDFSGDLSVQGTVNVGGTGTTGTMKIGGTGLLNLNGGTMSFDLSNVTTAGAGVNDLVNVAGDVSLFGISNISVNKLNGALTNGVYTLLTYAGFLSGDTSNLNLVGITSGARQNFVLDLNTPGALLLDVNGFAGNLTWVGNGTGNEWDHTVVNWTGAGDNHFFDGDPVTFNDTGSNTPAVQLGGSLQPASITLNNTTKDYTFAGTGTIDGITGITKNGTGTLTITTTNSFTGAVAVNAGTVSVPTVANGGTNSPLGAGTAVSLGDATHQGTLSVTGAGLTATTNRIFTLNAGGGAINIADAASNITVSSAITGTGGLVKTGNGTLTLSAVNTFTGGTTVNGGTLALTTGGLVGTLGGTVTINTGGTLQSQVSDTLGYGANRATIININGGTFTHTPAINLSVWGMTVNMTGGLLQATNGAGGRIDFGTDGNAGNVPTAINTLASASPATIGGVQVNLRQIDTTFTVANGSASIDLLLSAPVVEGIAGAGITKAGPGTMNVTGTNTYTGPTTINAGTLLVNGSISGSAVTVKNGGTLGGSGTTGALSVESGGVVSPGNSPGLLSTGALTMVSGAALALELNTTTPATGYDQLSVTGTVDLTGATLTLGGTYHTAPVVSNDLFFVLLNDGSDAITGNFNGLAEGSHVFSGNGQDYIITYGADAGTNSFTSGNDVALLAVPEPGAALSLLGGLGMLLGLRRRRTR